MFFIQIPYNLINSQDSFHFVRHFLVPWNPDDWDDCLNTEPGQGKIENVERSCKHSHHKGWHVEEAQGKEPCWNWDVFLNHSPLQIILLFPKDILHTTWFCNPWAGFWRWFTGVSFVLIMIFKIFFKPQTSSIMMIHWTMKLMQVAGIDKKVRIVVLVHSISIEEIEQW